MYTKINIRTLAIMFGVYLALLIIFLVIYRYIVFNSWDDLWNALVIPKVWASLLIASGFVLGVQVIFLINGDSNSNFVPWGLTLWLLAIISLIVVSVVPVEPAKQIGLTGLLFATVGLGTGFISLGLAKKSQEKTTAVANHGLFEKMAIIQQCLLDVGEFNSGELKISYADRIFYELKAAKELQKISSLEVAKLLDNELQNLIDKIPPEEKYDYLKNRLIEVSGNESMNIKIGTKPQNSKPPSQRVPNYIEKIITNFYRVCNNYIKGTYPKLSKTIVVIGLLILILSINNLFFHLEVNIGVPIAILVIGYLPLLISNRIRKKSWKEIMTTELDLLEILLLMFFVMMDSFALMSLYPGNYRQQNIIFYAGLLLSVILLIKVIRYKSKEPAEKQ